ncbi:MAG: hypothetical protein LBI04_09650 [Treponema sp.]|jgi:hypothetical protein|nr:hypothetical protein [Treponema sp.]
MATIKKTTTAKKVTAKKPSAKKPAAKKPAAKKTTAKKTAAKKPAAKKAVKKPAVKKAPAKKPAAKKAPAKKPAAKKTAAKKPAVKTAVKKPTAKKPAVKKVIDAPDDNVKYRNLFDAFAQGKLPFANGYIVSSFFSDKTAYSIFEIVSYAGVKEIFLTETGLQFVTGGKKLFVLVENDTYDKKFQEPVSRTMGESIPKRFNEVETIIAKNQTRIMVAKEPDELYGSFTILKPTSINFSVVFYQMPDVYTSLTTFFEETLNRQRKVPQIDARKAAQLITGVVQKSMSPQGEFV